MKTIREFLAQRPTGPLYHYTDAAGLLGIFEHKEIWASDALHMNDAKEYRHAEEVLREELENRIQSVTSSPEDKKIYQRALDAQPARLIGSAPMYVASFSANGDQLSQWRAYCQNGNGFSVGFEFSDLKYALERSKLRLIKCVYDRDEQKELIAASVDWALRGIRRVERWGSKALCLSLRLGEIGMAVMLALKHPSFREEDEWRLIGYHQLKEPLRFRPGRFGIVSYSAVPLCGPEQKPLFARIYVGPNDEPELARETIRMMMMKYSHIKFKDCGNYKASDTDERISNSECTYRS